jgi:hypothetical protein
MQNIPLVHADYEDTTMSARRNKLRRCLVIGACCIGIARCCILIAWIRLETGIKILGIKLGSGTVSWWWRARRWRRIEENEYGLAEALVFHDSIDETRT